MPHPHLLVDFAGVIGHHQNDSDLTAMAQVLDIETGDFVDRYWQQRGDYDRGLGDTSYWQRVATRPLPPVVVDQLVDLDRKSWTRLNPRTIDALARRHREGAAVTLLSNAPHFLASAVRDLTELEFFDAMTFSCELGVAKPDPESFRQALAAHGAHGADTIFIDDRRENIDAADALGIAGVLFVGANELDGSLEQLSGR